MCEIFPELSSCCLCVSLRLGMLYISVLTVMTGVLCLCAVVNNTRLNYKDLYTIPEIYKNITKSTELKEFFPHVNKMVKTLFSAFSCCFMFTGLMLFFGTLFESEGLVQVFVWVTLLNILLGMLMLIVTTFECIIFDDSCMLTASLDWLSAAILVIIAVLCFLLWIYFIAVANSYVIGEDY